jgi:hypothetical protein
MVEALPDVCIILSRSIPHWCAVPSNYFLAKLSSEHVKVILTGEGAVIIYHMSIFDWYTWVILPLIVFLVRLTDVTLGTMRIIFVARGRKYLAPLLGFIEVFIWITVVSQIVRGAQNIVAYLAYAAGFAVGNYVGMIVEERLWLNDPCDSPQRWSCTG